MSPTPISAENEEIVFGPPKMRRRPLLMALGVVLIAVSALVSWYVVTIVKDTEQVVAALVLIPRGQVITAADLTTVEIRPDPALKTIPAAQLNGLIGQRAATDIAAGVIVSPASVTTALVPEAGYALIGVALDVGQRPQTPPRLGQPITLIALDAPGGDDTTAAPLTSSAVRVVQYYQLSDALLVVDVTLPEAAAPPWVALAAAGRVAALWTAD